MARIGKIAFALLMLVSVVAAVIPLTRDVYQRPVRSVRIVGEFEHVTREHLRAAIETKLQSGFFGVDVGAVRELARQLPWVRDVKVERVWPDSLNITLLERSAVARWNDDALLENDASLFRPRGGIENYTYTQLLGPVGKHVYMLERYKRLATAFGTFGGGIRALSLSQQGQWEITFGNDMTLIPGTQLDVDALKAFANVMPRVLGTEIARVERIDLRYANGFAVRWRKPDALQTQGEKG